MPVLSFPSSFDGRSGTLIAVTLLLQQFRKDSEHIDVFGTVLALRKYRADAILSNVN